MKEQSREAWIAAQDFTDVNEALTKIANQLRGAKMYGAAEIEAIKAQAWDEGWHEHYLEWERQRKDASHPITCTNPYGETR